MKTIIFIVIWSILIAVLALWLQDLIFNNEDCVEKRREIYPIYEVGASTTQAGSIDVIECENGRERVSIVDKLDCGKEYFYEGLYFRTGKCEIDCSKVDCKVIDSEPITSDVIR